MSDLVTDWDKFVIYDPATNLFCKIHQEILYNDDADYDITWVSFGEATTIREKYITRIQDTFRNVLRLDYTGYKVDLELCKNIVALRETDTGVTSTLAEIQLVPVMIHPVKRNVDGCNFLSAESLFASVLGAV